MTRRYKKVERAGKLQAEGGGCGRPVAAAVPNGLRRVRISSVQGKVREQNPGLGA
jgi:hypothetical protein